MSRVAIFEGYGRRRKHEKLGMRVTPAAGAGYHWHKMKNRPKGAKTEAQKNFAKAADFCKVAFKGSGSPKAKRSTYNDCIREFIKTSKSGGKYKRGFKAKKK